MKTIDVEELKSIQLQILKHVDSFCKENGIKYFMCGGSLIGTIRHKGYIPWDDDIDIMMLREDYERFIKLYSSKDVSQFKLHCHANDSHYILPFAKIDDDTTMFIAEAEHNENIGVNVDVFPIDKVPETSRLQKKLYSCTKFYLNLFNLKNVSLCKERSFGKNLILFISHILLKAIPFKVLTKRIESMATKYKNEITTKCGIVVWGYGIREINNLSNYNEAVDAQFEDMVVPIPIGFDNYLRSVYGDYMQLPPEDKRISHHGFKAYWK